MNGKLIIFSAPSGAGKTTIVRQILRIFSQLEFSVSACSRAKRSGEVDGKDYYFLSADQFLKKIENNEFLEWEEVYKDYFYGTLKSEIERIWSKGNHVIFDVDVKGGLNIKKYYKEKSLAIFVMPPSRAHLSERLKQRSTDTEEDIKTRLAKAAEELKYAGQYDVIVVNDELDKAVHESEILIRKFLYD